MVSSQELAQAFIQLSTTHDNADVCADACISFLTDNHLQYLLPHVVKHMERLTATDESYNTLKFLTAFEKESKALAAEVAKKLDIKPVETVIATDQTLIGGFMAEYQGVRYDASIRNQLEILQETLTR